MTTDAADPRRHHRHPDRATFAEWVLGFRLDRAALGGRIRDEGEWPVHHGKVTGRVVLGLSEALGARSWFVLDEGYLWYCYANGGPNAKGWANNVDSVRADDPGAAGWRLPLPDDVRATLDALMARARGLVRIGRAHGLLSA